MTSDAQLVACVRLGEVEAFGQLVERYERSVLALALSKLRNLHEAEDVAQATLLLAFRRLETLRDDAKFGPWLLRIAHSQVIDAARARPIPANISLGDAEYPASGEWSQESWVENEHLLALVARLPERERHLIGLRYFDGHSMAEIAEISARPIGTVTKQLSRAMARLRTWCERGDAR